MNPGPNEQRRAKAASGIRRRIASGELAAFTVGRRILRVRPEDVDGLFRPLPSIARR